MTTAMFKDASRIYPKAARKAVDQLSLADGDGEFVVPVGPSGCRKTTSLRISPTSDSPVRAPGSQPSSTWLELGSEAYVYCQLAGNAKDAITAAPDVIVRVDPRCSQQRRHGRTARQRGLDAPLRLRIRSADPLEAEPTGSSRPERRPKEEAQRWWSS